ncbi:dienelactone hydrolase family protein [Sphingomonas sp. LaA6.9]|uniref:dienelactone hydrolase family protein n=1 Tax=Sphingomonas sp. LaA6.9 TaxID=2919914 RepID=UPI001F4F271B|nr:dienelactone hydrolase family protein [Sphingomonas sp. LaA6.9]MCJ8158514.1 dienelactone hydrolase family protein [Sphingomonas sp. LaA6.9]
MAITRRTMVYDGPGGTFESVLAWDDATTAPRPGVLVFPNVLGQKEFDNQRAERLAALGYVALATDLFGQGKRKTREDADFAGHMVALLADHDLLRERLLHAHATLKTLDEVDAARTGAIGFCFGGRCCLDLARAGADVAGVASFHGIYTRPPWPNAKITAKILVLHGWDDPLAPPEDVVALASELTDAGVDWQLHAHGHTGHAFTDPGVHMHERGLFHQPDADRRSWQAMENFFAETFGAG